VLTHAFYNATGNHPDETFPWEVAETARRYPEARIVMAHIAGDYIMGVWAIRDVPNVWTDISGTYCEAGMVGTAVRELGAARVVFGSDNGIAFNLGKVQDAGISDKDRARILYYNAKELLR
jgi:predicted TIM-barrel fold metal-dependent hydrolase